VGGINRRILVQASSLWFYQYETLT
jgi:hypothetical protein